MAVEKVIEKISGLWLRSLLYPKRNKDGKSREMPSRSWVSVPRWMNWPFIGAVIQADQLGVSVGSILGSVDTSG